MWVYEFFPPGETSQSVSSTAEISGKYTQRVTPVIARGAVTVEQPVPASDPRSDSGTGLVIVMEKTVIPLNATMDFYLENQGSVVDKFTSGYPFTVEFSGNSGWTRVAGSGGTAGFWKLRSGETSRKMVWSTKRVREYQAAGLIDPSEVQETGRFRICVQTFVGGYPLQNEVTTCREFIVTP